MEGINMDLKLAISKSYHIQHCIDNYNSYQATKKLAVEYDMNLKDAYHMIKKGITLIKKTKLSPDYDNRKFVLEIFPYSNMFPMIKNNILYDAIDGHKIIIAYL